MELAFVAAAAAAVTSKIIGRTRLAAAAVALPSTRGLHVGQVPRMGGVAIASGVMSALLFHRPLAASRPLTVFLPTVGALLVFAVGLLDDVRGVRPAVRIIVHLVAAVTAIYGSELGLGRGAFAVFLVVAAVNAFNFMDGIDGLAAGKALLTCLAIVALLDLPPPWAAVLYALAGACSGFLPFNLRTQGKLFLGDAGSTTIGYLLAVVVVMHMSWTPAGFATAGLVAGSFAIDTALVLLDRRARGEPLSQAHREHAYQLLVWLCHLPHSVAMCAVLGWDALLVVFALSHPGACRAVFILAIGALPYLGLRLHYRRLAAKMQA